MVSYGTRHYVQQRFVKRSITNFSRSSQQISVVPANGGRDKRGTVVLSYGTRHYVQQRFVKRSITHIC